MSLGTRAWTALALTHRWLGTGGCLLFVVWFVSGVAMVYVRMPELTAAERLARAPAIPPGAIGVGPDHARRTAGRPEEAAVVLEMLGARPVYRIGAPPVTVFADTGERLTTVTAVAATAAAAAFAGGPVRLLDQLVSPDQWTLQLRPHLPLFHFAVGAPGDGELYVSGTTGAVVLDTSRRERAWAYLGPVAHWLYLPILRRNSWLWSQVIIWTSAVGCVLCLSGLIAGVWRLRRGLDSPYAGWLRWHHYAGLLFGVVTLTWTFSGLLSMGPFGWLSDPPPDAADRRLLSGERPAVSLSAADVRRAIARLGPERPSKELRLLAFQGRAYWLGRDASDRSRLVDAIDAAARPMDRFPATAIEAAVLAVDDAELQWLSDYDDYYYERSGRRPLPVARVRFRDGRWLYVDPARGEIALGVGPRDRLNRWLYHGLHSLDPAWLRRRRPLWDLVVVLLSLGGLAGVATSLVPAWRRVTRVVRGATVAGRR